MKPYSKLVHFWTSSIVRNSKYEKTQHFGNCICFRPQVRGGFPTLLAALEIANPNHWTHLFLRNPIE
jgi:hypothetical protein